ncbi:MULTISPECIES: cbb3-type cytochrome c oxidase N-terminal domain-containing protein [Tenacibaculum]|uniref:Cbb3-type cytochrome c oxidase N-terminal domain-containing protein n=1 Tax=Tenacibaculum discolor TaxID=361581 RepID=A0A2G1BYK1_9FLAO|nr:MULTISPECIES: cbb3-type cytochrome c oxidase N-terminal domain-containing protein [Tenacibaculum]MDP2541262.1 cbb3-type cytochrome c oxidase N-terminal domain-containing protein [Tenacibaculum discolor]NVK09947.1 c-type cytochrome [Tenacibaculum sp.]PHN98959.1 cytochrome C oxidase subunit III [Tenacibaculum discolor]RLJ97849.1 cytochrome c oxidase cbb3-type subunit 3 [Tenacibaculum discolor]
MKKYFQSIVYIIFVAVTFFAIVTAIKSYENPFSLYEHPLVWIAIVGLVTVVVLKEALNIVSQQKAEQLQMEKDGIQPEEVDNWAWAKKIINKWTEAKAIEEEDEIILDHNYDGIKELDNNLPPWWLYMFYATIIFAAVYLVRYHVLGADNQEMEYAQAVAEAKRELAAFKSNSKEAVIDAETVTVLTDAGDLSRGKAVYNLNCAACHIADGGGGIGPNLTDEYWILGGGIKNIFNTISNGGRDGKGMVAWNKTLKPKDIQKVASYILSLQGTTPAKPKEPQGELYKEEGAAPAVAEPDEQPKDSIQ